MPLNNVDSFFTVRQCQPSFSSFGIINRIIYFPQIELIFEI